MFSPIEIHRFDGQNIKHANQVDGSYWVDSRLSISALDGKIAFSIVPVTGFMRPYIYSDLDPEAHKSEPDYALFLAVGNGGLAGQITLNHKWNRFASVEDFVVEPRYRRQGVGNMLMDRAVEWAKENDYPGITLETQDVNVPACLFYQSFGFELAGFDRLLYKATLPEKDEFALYWYLLF